MKNIKILMQFLLFGFCMISCKKYLEVLPDKKLVTIRNLEDLSSLLSAYYTINHIDPGVGEASSDNNYLSETAWQGIDEYERALYIWGAENVIRPYSYYGSGNCWSNSYNVVYLSNTVLTEIEHIKRSNINKHDWDKIKGEAYFLRGKSFLALASVFCLAFDSATADSDFGIPLRITPDFNELSIRSTLRETFEQIESDLLNAVPLLPKEPFHVMLPGKAAALGYLARLYHYMRKYDLALKYADSCLKLHNSLLDYNIDIQPSDLYPFKRFNKEVIYACRMAYPASLQYGRVDLNLYNSYADNDIRKVVFFRDMGDGSFRFRGSYDNTITPFTGVSVDEVYLVRAECKIRRGKINEGLSDLNTLLLTRWLPGTFTSYATDNLEEALNIVIEERRKELAFRELRWMDIKRLNKEGWNIGLYRKLGDIEYKLPPNSLLYAMAIPEDVINRTGMLQNPR